MREYELYVPLRGNDGRAVPRRLGRLRRQLVEQFGGLTHFPQQNEGFWKIGSFTFRDKIVILRVLSDDPAAETFLRRLKENLKKEWEQKDILIVIREVCLL
ncbi:MAG TPA: hypothetical protein VFA77_03070 [Candidatus Eisenbacteria bacterium]|nr:hypothetical protein [Candidatus Eisenbacteria bacterium]